MLSALGAPLVSIADLQLAFTLHIVRRVARADGKISPNERQYLDQVAPPMVLRDRQWLNGKGQLTTTYLDALGAALIRLPDELDQDAKLDLLRKVYDAVIVDGRFEYQESKELLYAGSLLGLAPSSLTHLIEDEVGHESIELPPPE